MNNPWEDTTYEPWTPVDAENALRWVLRAMHDAHRTLADMRDIEVSARHEYERARRIAILSDSCPKVTRGGFTTAERDAWVDRECAANRERWELAQSTREAAQDHLRTLNSQAVVMSSLAKNVQQTYGVVGVR